MPKFFLLSITVIALLFGAWTYHSTHHPSTDKQSLVAATIFSQPRNISAFQLVDAHNQVFNAQNLKGHWSLLFFGFSNCPDLCPTTLATLNQAYNKLAATSAKHLPQVVFISVDPERDDPERINEYLASFNKHFLGATGDSSQIDQLTHELSVLYSKVAVSDNSSNYSIDHSGTILIINPEGQFYGVFTTPHDASKIAEDMRKIASKDSSAKT